MQWAQTLLIIVLAIIGIVVFIVLLIELINIPKPLVVPFADGTKIKIKSLANNLYLRPVSCNDLSNCGNLLVTTNCETLPGQNIVSAIGQADDPLTTWQLCQYSPLSDEGDAKYLIYSLNTQSTFVMGLFDSLLVLRQTPDICTVAKTKQLICPTGTNIDTYFSFILNEKSSGNTTSGSYNIVSTCYPTGNNYVVTSGQGAVVLPSPSNTCPPVVTTQIDQNFGCPQPTGDPRCTLGYLFVIEVQS